VEENIIKFFSTSTVPMPSSTTTDDAEGILMDESGGGTMWPRQAPADDEMLPDPGQVADPSLVPVQLNRPDYRPLIAEGPSPIPPTPPPTTPADSTASSTVEQMGDEATTTTTTGTGETEPEPTTTEAAGTNKANEAETAQAEVKKKEKGKVPGILN
jgi:hypothetical protein